MVMLRFKRKHLRFRALSFVSAAPALAAVTRLIRFSRKT
jgi:hypothetical protein